MRICCLEHVAFEGPGRIAGWASDRGHSVQRRLVPIDGLPYVDGFEMLVVMGGPMGVRDDAEYPWLVPERGLVQRAVRSGRLVLGICLGAQILASALGADVAKNREAEIGWFPVDASSTPAGSVLSALPARFTALHWHSDTFGMPDGLPSAVSSAACRNQAFETAEGRAVGLQFHLEVTPEGLADLAAHCGEDLALPGAVQPLEELLVEDGRFELANGLMDSFLDAFAGRYLPK